MATLKPRINLTVEQLLFKDLSEIAKKAGQSVSSVAKNLIIAGLENREDSYLSEIADSRYEPNSKKHIGADVVWDKYFKAKK